MKTTKKALLLIPCARKRSNYNTRANTNIAPIHQGIITLRNTIRKHGVMPTAGSPYIQALEHYGGQFYTYNARMFLRNVVANKFPQLDVLIVSGCYGLLKIDEPIQDYNVDIRNRFSGQRLDRLLVSCGIIDILRDHIKNNNITHVWSLLPQSEHDMFFDYRNHQNGVICCHVKSGQGNSVVGRRSAWMVYTTQTNVNWFLSNPMPPNVLSKLTYNYPQCYLK
ncbi:MAG: hypothetical protein NTW04_04995 [Elusimicrobia bacterium]|nr:hypothetical protein [Elusimicrobiota bacterium]